MTDAEARVVLAYYDERAESMWLAPDKAAYNRYLFNRLHHLRRPDLVRAATLPLDRLGHGDRDAHQLLVVREVVPLLGRDGVTPKLRRLLDQLVGPLDQHVGDLPRHVRRHTPPAEPSPDRVRVFLDRAAEFSACETGAVEQRACDLLNDLNGNTKFTIAHRYTSPSDYIIYPYIKQ
jgi:hypothetical protein